MVGVRPLIASFIRLRWLILRDEGLVLVMLDLVWIIVRRKNFFSAYVFLGGRSLLRYLSRSSVGVLLVKHRKHSRGVFLFECLVRCRVGLVLLWLRVVRVVGLGMIWAICQLHAVRYYLRMWFEPTLLPGFVVGF